MYKNRRKNLINSLKPNSLVILFSGLEIKKSADQNYPFYVNKNFFYLTGLKDSNFVLLLSNHNNKVIEYLFIDIIDPLMARWVDSKTDINECAKISGINSENIKDIKNLDTFLSTLLEISRKSIIENVENIYFDFEGTIESNPNNQAFSYSTKLKKQHPYLNLENAYNLISNARRYKDAYEVEQIKKAIDITKLGLEAIYNKTKEAKNEIELASIYHYTLNLHDVAPSFDTIIGSGVNGTILHYHKNNSPILPNSLVLCDLGVEYNGYASDITRTYPVNHKFTPRQKQLYEIVLKANKESINFLRPGITHQEFLEFGKKILTDGLKEIGLIKEDSEISKYYFHGLGHYLGLDTHDVGSYNEPFKEGIVITVEPGLYIPEESIGIRIEDDVLITKTGSICLSSSIKKEIKDLED